MLLLALTWGVGSWVSRDGYGRCRRYCGCWGGNTGLPILHSWPICFCIIQNRGRADLSSQCRRSNCGAFDRRGDVLWLIHIRVRICSVSLAASWVLSRLLVGRATRRLNVGSCCRCVRCHRHVYISTCTWFGFYGRSQSDQYTKNGPYWGCM